jgi:hypothetical protein
VSEPQTTPPSFRELAERRIEVLEQREQERKIAAEARAAEQQAGQVELRERREAKRRAEAEQQAAETLAALARDHGQEVAGRVRLGSEFYVFTVPARGGVVAYGRPAGSTSRDSWRHQQRLQEQLGVGLDPPAILVGAQLGEAAAGVALLVDPTPAELAPTESRTP